MTPSDKRNPGDAWKALEAKWASAGPGGEGTSGAADEAALRARVAAEVARVGQLSDDEVDAELRAQGVDPEGVRARGQAQRERNATGTTEAVGEPRVAVAVPQVDPRAPEREPKAVPLRRVAPLWLFAAALVLVGLGAAAALGFFTPKPPPPVPEAPPLVPEPPSPPSTRLAVETPHEAALRFFAAAKSACAQSDWETCLAMGERARLTDPDGIGRAPELIALLEAATNAEGPKDPSPRPARGDR